MFVNSDALMLVSNAADAILLTNTIANYKVNLKAIITSGGGHADQGTTVLRVEQDVNHSLRLSDRGYVLEHGRISMEGRAEDLLGDPHIKAAYLGISVPPCQNLPLPGPSLFLTKSLFYPIRITVKVRDPDAAPVNLYFSLPVRDEADQFSSLEHFEKGHHKWRFPVSRLYV